MHYLSKKYLRNCHQTERRVISESIKVHETIFRPRWSKLYFKQFGNLTAQNVHSKDATYHKNCYSNVVIERNLGRAIERQKRAKKKYDATFISPKRGRPISFSPRTTILEGSSSTSNSTKHLRSTVIPYNSSMCIICQR